MAWSHMFSVETVPFKRDFALMHSEPKQAFSDAVHLSNNGWRGVELSSNSIQEIADVDIVFAGPECKSVSSLNRLAKEMRDCIRSDVIVRCHERLAHGWALGPPGRVETFLHTFGSDR